MLFIYSISIYCTNVSRNSAFKDKFDVVLPLINLYLPKHCQCTAVHYRMTENKIKQTKAKRFDLLRGQCHGSNFSF